MVKISVFVVILLFLVVGLSGCNEQSIGSKTLYVDNKGGKDYTSIQAAINDAKDGDTIYVYSGIYNENLLINKCIQLIGENNYDTIIIGKGNNDIIYLGKGKTTIRNFMIDGETGITGIKVNSSLNIISDNNLTKCYDGLYLYNSPENTINNNIFALNSCGIYMSNSDRCIIENNIIYSNKSLNYTANNFGLYITNCNKTKIKNNTFLNTYRGIQTFSSNKLTIYENIFNNSYSSGLQLSDNSNENEIFDNRYYSNKYGLIIQDSNKNIVYNNNFFNQPYINAQEAANLPNDFFTSILLDNSWDYNSKGNFWDDYQGIDADGNGIGDSPYNISVAYSSQKEWNQDKFPLMKPFDI